MTTLNKFERIVGWYARACNGPVRQLKPQSDPVQPDRIEALLGETLPPDIRALFTRYDGEEQGEAAGSFLGHGLVSAGRAIDSLEFSKSLRKPANPVIHDLEGANNLIAEMIAIHVRAFRLRSLLGRAWHKLEFACGPGMYEGPYLYRKPSTKDSDRDTLQMPSERTNEVIELAELLHGQELAGYNWDRLRVITFADGSHTVERSFYDYNETERRVWPEGSIKSGYFNEKWCPIIEDYGGNYIGADLDPGSAGLKGQIIVFGRDEDDMYVLARSWEMFLDLLLERIEAGGDEFRRDVHLHDLLRPAELTL